MSKASESSRPPIAVVGVSALFPGSIDATGFWKDILNGSDLITDVPPTHWLIEDYYDPDPSVPDKTYAKRGAFLKDVDFDSLGWGVPPSLIPETDTSQLGLGELSAPVMADMLEASVIGDMVLAAVLANDLYIFSHPGLKPVVDARSAAINESFARWAQYRKDHSI